MNLWSTTRALCNNIHETIEAGLPYLRVDPALSKISIKLARIYTHSRLLKLYQLLLIDYWKVMLHWNIPLKVLMPWSQK